MFVPILSFLIFPHAFHNVLSIFMVYLHAFFVCTAFCGVFAPLTYRISAFLSYETEYSFSAFEYYAIISARNQIGAVTYNPAGFGFHHGISLFQDSERMIFFQKQPAVFQAVLALNNQIFIGEWGLGAFMYDDAGFLLVADRKSVV